MKFVHTKGGMMSNLIALDMRKKLKNNNKNWFITTQVIDEFTDDEQTTIILIDLQIKYELNSIKNKVANKNTIICSPDRNIFASFNSQKMIDYINQKIEGEN